MEFERLLICFKGHSVTIKTKQYNTNNAVWNVRKDTTIMTTYFNGPLLVPSFIQLVNISLDEIAEICTTSLRLVMIATLFTHRSLGD